MSPGLPVRRKKDATYADICALPEGWTGQIIDGDLYALPRPAPLHALGASNLGGELNPPFGRGRGGPGGWWILDEPELHLGRDVLVPDLAGWRKERMPRLPQTAYFTIAPDWICEVLSPSTRSLDRIKKLAKYASYEVAYAWILDPDEKSLEVFVRSAEGHWTFIGGYGADEKVRAVPFDAVEIDLSGLWEPPDPAEEDPSRPGE